MRHMHVVLLWKNTPTRGSVGLQQLAVLDVCAAVPTAQEKYLSQHKQPFWLFVV